MKRRCMCSREDEMKVHVQWRGLNEGACAVERVK
jgi:hypothetical protein